MPLYRAYDLLIQSDFPCPELLPADGGEPQVRFRLGEVPERLPERKSWGALFDVAEDRFLLRLEGVARYLVQGGEEIRVQPEAGSSAEAMRVFLFTSCLGALLHQRNLLVLHASAIRAGDGAALFAGDSGLGKSTLLAAFLGRGYAMLADDVCAVDVDSSGRAMVLPAFPRVKLWADAVEALGLDTSSLHRVREELDKYQVPAGDLYQPEPLPLRQLFLLGEHARETLLVAPLPPSQRMGAVVNHTYRSRFVSGLRARERHFHLAAAAASQVRGFILRRSPRIEGLGSLADRLEGLLSEGTLA